RALDIFEQIDHLHGQVVTRLNLSSRYKDTGQISLARQVLAEALPLARELGLTDDEARILSSLGELLTNTGEYEAASEVLAEAEQVAGRLDSPLLRATVQYRLGELYLATGDWSQAVERFERALAEYKVSGYTYYQTLTRSRLAASLHRRGDLGRAITLSSQALAEMDARSDDSLILETCLHHYQIMTTAGQPETARQALERAYAEVQARCAALPEPAWRESFIWSVPLHHEIVAAWQALQSQRTTVRLPRADAPRGRPLRDDEYVTVAWTPTAPEDDEISPKIARRRHRLLRLLREAEEQGASPTVDDLAKALAVSPTTLKRDLAALRREGHPLKTRGSR
ncbi:MAG TPA: tetratricopeptide repeat protein, partial [Anaerolineae bacterium]|nr:tetratricopeptide repeat protein [Anaerolineae bacterium]